MTDTDGNLDILSEALAIVRTSKKAYGEASENLELIASLWSMYLGVGINLHNKDVALMMILLKIARAKHPLFHKDNYVDIAGYAAIAAEQDEQGI